LLASPHHGERWGRHWLDVTRFAETHGYERDDPKPNAWRYRDYVIRAFNQDKPYDVFLTEQLAGDEMPNSTPESRVATGLHRLGLIDDEPADPVADRFDQLDDMVKTVGSTFLGLTIHCARCHEHKFDPISQADYYRLVSFFAPSQPYVRDNLQSISLPLASESELQRVKDLNSAIDRQIAQVRERIGKVPEADKGSREPLENLIRHLEGTRPAALPVTLGLTDKGAMAEPTKLLIRGDAHNPGEEVKPGYLWAVDRQTPEISPGAGGTTTGRRLALAGWITGPQNPLTARVMANRIWHYHFGRGIVGTPSDFGSMGEPPIHPELLDWLAGELVDPADPADRWRLKRIHRLIVTSRAYRQTSIARSEALAADSGSRLLWRYPPRRLEAEPLRDAILAVSGSLNPKTRGPGFDLFEPNTNYVKVYNTKTTFTDDDFRRMVYQSKPRAELDSFFGAFDCPDAGQVQPKRTMSTTPLQALNMLNGAFILDQSNRFAARVEREVGSDPSLQVARAMELAFGRQATDKELAAGRSLVATHGLPILCRSLYNASEFITIY